MNTYYRDSNKRIFKDPLDVKRSSRWSLVPMEGQRLESEHQNWLIIDFKYYGDSKCLVRPAVIMLVTILVISHK
jgi:hypothetical protein